MDEEASMDHLFLDKVNDAIENNLANHNFGVEELAIEIGISRSQLHRKLESLSKPSAKQMIKEFRLKKAMEMLQNNVGTASEISYEVGFSSPSYFNSCFHEYFGYTPGKAKRKGSFKKKDKPVTSNSWKIAGYISFVVIVGLIVFNVLSRSDRLEELPVPDKSLAVLPFINDSPDKEYEYMIKGYMTSVHDNLCRIKDLRVLSIRSTQQYRDNSKPFTEISKELNVGYLLDARGQMYNNNMRLIVQLIDADGNIIWSHPFDRLINDMGDHISIQVEIAQLVAKKLQAVITPEEKQLMEIIPTLSLTAYDFYQRGEEERRKYIFFEDKGPLKRAESFYHKALEYDSTYALAYAGLAWANWCKQWWDPYTYFSESFMDSVLILAEIAHSYDNQLSEAYFMKGHYYYYKGLLEKAEKEYDKAIRYKPNDGRAYNRKAYLYSCDDLIKTIDNIQKAASLSGGPGLSGILRRLGSAYMDAGFPEKTYYYLQEALKLDGDSTKYYGGLANAERSLGNYEKAIEYGKKGFSINSIYTMNLFTLGSCYMLLGQYEESLKYFKIFIEKRKAIGPFFFGLQRVGYAFCQNGFKKEAEYYFNEQINYYNRMNELGRKFSTQVFMTYFDLASVYAFRGEKDKAYENLKIFTQRRSMPYGLVVRIKNDPLFNSIRDEPEFQQIVKEVEAKYEEEHERVRKWLEENDML